MGLGTFYGRQPTSWGDVTLMCSYNGSLWHPLIPHSSLNPQRSNNHSGGSTDPFFSGDRLGIPTFLPSVLRSAALAGLSQNRDAPAGSSNTVARAHW